MALVQKQSISKKPRDKATVVINGIEYETTVINVNEFREPSQKYVVEIESGEDTATVFVSENQIIK